MPGVAEPPRFLRMPHRQQSLQLGVSCCFLARMRSRGRPGSLRRSPADISLGMRPDGGLEDSSNRRKWRSKVAWTATLCVLLGVLMWVRGGGLDVQPSTPSATDEAAQGTGGTNTSPVTPVGGSGAGAGGGGQGEGGGRSTTPRPPPVDAAEAKRLAEAFDGEVTTQLHKHALSKGLDKDEMEAARVAATLAVREAMLAPEDLPPPSSEAYYSQACGVRVEGSLPLYHSNGQRCCKANQLPQPGAPGGFPGIDLAALEGGSREVGSGEDGAGGGAREGALPGVLRTQKTGAAGGQEVSCFPSFIIAGTQKSGTTALTGILEKHPQVRMAARKELHFFDNKSPNMRTAEMYASNFARFNASQAMEHRAPFVVGEATPFYWASRSACMNMRKLIPDVRLVVLVREPVKRAYSEHQMKVRRVEEQEEILKLLPLNANKIYDCAVNLFPNTADGTISESSEGLLAGPQTLTAALGECAGEVGDHGKWMDFMIPFIRRVKAKYHTRGKGVAKTDDPIAAREVLREDLSRCFPLKEVAHDMEELFPGGAWKLGWARNPTGMEMPGMPGLPGASRRPAPPKAGGARPGMHGGKKGPAALPPWWGKRDREHRNLHLYQEQGWFADADLDLDLLPANLAHHHNSALHKQYWNMTAEAAAAAAYAAAYEGGASAADGFFGLYGADGGGWAGDVDGDGYMERSAAGDAYVSGAAGFAPGDEEDDVLYEGEFLGHDAEAAAGANPSKRELRGKDVFPGVPWADVWGEWGKQGERVFDESCYQRMERVTPVGQVMRSEMTRLRKCFNDALSGMGGLEGLAEAEAPAAAGAIESRLSKCFTITPGISDQYIYRSLYGVQTYRCLKHMPRDQVMFIESDDLRDNPEEILPRVHKHIGVPDFKYPALDQGAIMAELEKKYPDFEKRTGWRLDSAYKQQIPADLEKEMREFLAPHMKMFARLTGQSFGDWAVDDRHQKDAMAGGAERPIELFEEEFFKEVTRMARAKSKGTGTATDTVGEGGGKGSAPAADENRAGGGGAAAAVRAPP